MSTDEQAPACEGACAVGAQVPTLSRARSLESRFGVWLETHAPAVYKALWTAMTRPSAGDTIPWAPLRVPLSQARIALVTTGGVHRRSDTPFNVSAAVGDPSYRLIPAETDPAELMVTHIFYDHQDADADIGVMFPLAELQQLAAAGEIGAVAPRHFGFNGAIMDLAPLTQGWAPAVASALKADAVDAVVLTPG